MSTFRINDFPPDETPVATLYSRGSDTALTPTYTGTEERTNLYEFDIGARANGDYDVEIPFDDVIYRYSLRVATAGNTIADSWVVMDTISAIGSPLQVGDEYRWTNQDGDTIDVVIGEVP
jgi:hypothetical protein